MSYFTTNKRGDETITVLNDNAPEWVRGAVFDCHDGMLPDDWTYAACASAFEHVAAESDHFEGWADSNVDVYTHDLIEWSKGRTHLVDRALTEFGGTMTGAIQLAQTFELERIADTVAEAISDNAWDGDTWLCHQCLAGGTREPIDYCQGHGELGR